MSGRLIATSALAGLFLAGTGLAENPRQSAHLQVLAGNALAEMPPLRSGPPVGAKNNRSGFFPNYVAGAFTGERRCPV